jgi:regulator of protease activity HflC (stomatin/prohibitin superfamily)
MIAQASTIEQLIRDYIEQKERSMYYGKKRLDAEKEYNKLLTHYDGEAKHYTLEQADKIYKAYLEMIANGEESSKAHALFEEIAEKLREVGQILFEATINAQILLKPVNGEAASTKSVRVTYVNGQVVVS